MRVEIIDSIEEKKNKNGRYKVIYTKKIVEAVLYDFMDNYRRILYYYCRLSFRGTKMVLAYQLAIFSIIIISSFFGFMALFTAVALIVLFSFSNIFTATLLVIQLTTIAVATCIGAVISSIKLIKSVPNSVNKAKNYLDNSSFDFLPSFIFVNCLRSLIMMAVFLILGIFDRYSDIEIIETIMGIILVGAIFIICIIGNKIKYKPNSFIQKASFTSFIVACTSVYMGIKIIEVIASKFFY